MISVWSSGVCERLWKRTRLFKRWRRVSRLSPDGEDVESQMVNSRSCNASAWSGSTEGCDTLMVHNSEIVSLVVVQGALH